MTSENQMLQIFQCGSDRQQPVCTICKWLMASINLILNHLIDESRPKLRTNKNEFFCRIALNGSGRLPGVGIGCDAIGVRPIVFQNWEFPIQFLHQLTLHWRLDHWQCHAWAWMTRRGVFSAHIVQCTVHTVYTVQWRKCVQCCTSFKKLTLSNHWLVVLSVSTSRWSRVDLHSIPYHLTRTSWSCSQIMFSSVNLGICEQPL